MIVTVITMRMMQMSVVNVIDMTVVFDRGVAAAWGVLVTVVWMGVEIAHKIGQLIESLVDPGQSRNIIESHGLQ